MVQLLVCTPASPGYLMTVDLILALTRAEQFSWRQGRTVARTGARVCFVTAYFIDYFNGEMVRQSG